LQLFDAQLSQLVDQYGYLGLAGLVGLESMGVPLPGETFLVATAALAGSTHNLNIVWIVVAASAGAILGDNAGFWLGRKFGRRLLLRYGHTVRIDTRRIKLGQYLFARWGGWVVFFGRFVAVLRAWAALLAGANRMPWMKFLLFNAAGGVIWASAFGFGGYALGKTVTSISGPFGVGLALAALAAVVVGFVLVHRFEDDLAKRAEEALPGPLSWD